MFRLSPQLMIATAGALSRMSVLRDETLTDERVPDASLDGSCVAPERASDVEFIQRCGYWSHYNYKYRRSSWPIPSGLSARDLGAFADARNVLYTEPEAGDIFLQFNPVRKAFVRVGLVLNVDDAGNLDGRNPYFEVYTIEGNTDEVGHMGGGRTRRARRTLYPRHGDRFVRWAELDEMDTLLARADAFVARGDGRMS